MICGNICCREVIFQTAREMCLAALTAPKACGRESINCTILEGKEIDMLVKEMDRIEEETLDCRPIFIRDSKLVAQCEAVVLIGAVNQSRGLKPCGLCDYHDCGEMQKNGSHCAFDDIDLGIAVGSAVSIAADRRVDNRVLYSAGIAAMNLNMLGENTGTTLAIPLSVSSRNIFFTRT